MKSRDSCSNHSKKKTYHTKWSFRRGSNLVDFKRGFLTSLAFFKSLTLCLYFTRNDLGRIQTPGYVRLPFPLLPRSSRTFPSDSMNTCQCIIKTIIGMTGVRIRLTSKAAKQNNIERVIIDLFHTHHRPRFSARNVYFLAFPRNTKL